MYDISNIFDQKIAYFQHFCRSRQMQKHGGPKKRGHRLMTIILSNLACNFAKYSPILKKIFKYRLNNKPFLIWLSTTPPHLKYAVTLPCNLSLKACFADINVSQGSVATYARRGSIF